MKNNTTNKGIPINMRATPRQVDLIQLAADAIGKNRSVFMLESACREAENVLLDRKVFVFSDSEYKKLSARLKAPAKMNRKLQLLLETKPPWEK